jgi:hypothetical protein
MSGAKALLEKIRDRYTTMQLLTMHCCSDTTPDAIPGMVEQRADLMRQIAADERLLKRSPVEADGAVLNGLRKEIAEIILTIAELDRQLEQAIRHQMQKVKNELSALYNTSRAASAYTLQRR